MKATAKDLRFHSRELLDVVSRGEEVVITYRGRPCAKLVPLEPSEDEKDNAAEDELFGLWQDHDGIDDVDAHVRTLRKGRF